MTVSQGEKIVVGIVGAIALGLVFGTITKANDSNGKITQSSYSIQVVEPGIVKVALQMSDLPGGIKQPGLLLLAETSSRCERVSPLIVNSYVDEDIFYVDIGAYAIKPGESNCGDNFQLSEALIPIEEIFNKDENNKETKIILRNSTNDFNLSRDQYAVYLQPINTINALLQTVDGNNKETIVICLKKSSSTMAPAECRD